jgi:hypothetical protein
MGVTGADQKVRANMLALAQMPWKKKRQSPPYFTHFNKRKPGDKSSIRQHSIDKSLCVIQGRLPAVASSSIFGGTSRPRKAKPQKKGLSAIPCWILFQLMKQIRARLYWLRKWTADFY